MIRVVALAFLVAMSPVAQARDATAAAAQAGGFADRLPRGGIIPGMSPGVLATLDLSAEQRGRIDDVKRELDRKHAGLIRAIRELRWKRRALFRAPELDLDAARRNRDETSALRKEMFEAALEARKRVEAILTPEQRVRASEWVDPSPPGHRVVEPATGR